MGYAGKSVWVYWLAPPYKYTIYYNIQQHFKYIIKCVFFRAHVKDLLHVARVLSLEPHFLSLTFDQSHDHQNTQIWGFFAEEMKFFNLFGRLKSNVIGMIHVGALPG